MYINFIISVHICGLFFSGKEVIVMSKRQKDFMYFLIKYKGYTSIEAGILASILVKY